MELPPGSVDKMLGCTKNSHELMPDAGRVGGRHGVEPGRGPRGGARADPDVDVGGRSGGGGGGGEVEPIGGDHEAGDRPEHRSREIVQQLRCAATCKSLRRRILHQEFRHRHRAGNASLLVGVSYRLRTDLNTFVCVTSSSSPLRFNASLLESFEPMVSRDGLVVLKQRVANNAGDGEHHNNGFFFKGRNHSFNLCVCSIFTGGDVTTFLPAMDPAMHVNMESNKNIYPPALLAVGVVAAAGRSFELLVMDCNLRTQTFSSENGGWNAVRTAHLAPGHQRPRIPAPNSFPAIVGRAVHWLGVANNYGQDGGAYGVRIVALHADTAAAKTIDLPAGCVDRMLGCSIAKSMSELMLAASQGGTALSLVVAERELISVWTLEAAPEEERWSRQVVITRLAIDRRVEARRLYQTVFFEGFGERSRTVLMRINNVGLVQLDLATKKAIVVRENSSVGKWSGGSMSRACFHEMDLYSLLQSMKPF
uniref:DUF7595 domain-containing protein n=1 Tax=Oryza punctata TaxID=4537 RepID=A0A0E0KJN1_ORYPU